MRRLGSRPPPELTATSSSLRSHRTIASQTASSRSYPIKPKLALRVPRYVPTNPAIAPSRRPRRGNHGRLLHALGAGRPRRSSALDTPWLKLDLGGRLEATSSGRRWSANSGNQRNSRRVNLFCCLGVCPAGATGAEPMIDLAKTHFKRCQAQKSKLT
jgi:hypothetical protein